MPTFSKFSTEEETALKQFRVRTEKYLTNPTDDFLIKWIRARNMDLDKAEDMLTKSLDWRQKIGIRKLLDYSAPKEVTEDFIYKFTGTDNEGRPILIVPFGRWHVRRLLGEGFREPGFKYLHRLLEKLSDSAEISKPKNFIIILDSGELTFHKVAHYETIEVVIQLFREFESNYPETLYKAYVINTPWIFSYAFNFVKPFLTMHTLGKVSIFANEKDWKPVLHEALPLNTIPTNYGGTFPSFFE